MTTLNFPRHRMGAWAAERAMEPGHDRSEAHRLVKIECSLVERESVGPVSATNQRRKTQEAVA